jgi:hypothetical protein
VKFEMEERKRDTKRERKKRRTISQADLPVEGALGLGLVLTVSTESGQGKFRRRVRFRGLRNSGLDFRQGIQPWEMRWIWVVWSFEKQHLQIQLC